MGTHPIFESDFDCLTEMNKLNEQERRIYSEKCKNRLKDELETFTPPKLENLNKFESFKIFDLVNFENEENEIEILSLEMKKSIRLGENVVNSENIIPHVIWDNIQFDPVSSSTIL